MNRSGFALHVLVRVQKFICILSLLMLSACGGGSGGGSGSGSGGGAQAFSGQVAKGLASGSSVSLYSLTSAGVRTFVLSTVTDSHGGFTLPRVLQSGQVYLLEAVGGQYVNEITGTTEPLATPMRAVFVANGSENRFAVTAISEAVALEVERSASANKWSAGSVANATSIVNTAFGLPSPFDLKVIDLTTYVAGSDPSLSNADITLSFHVGFFAGFLHEQRLRNPGQTFADSLQGFHEFMTSSSPDDRLTSAWTAGLIRFVEKVPTLAGNRASFYTSIGLPSNTDSNQFSGGESTGQSQVPVPNLSLRLLSPKFTASQPTTDTLFNSRGALVAYRKGYANSGLDFSHVGYANVAEVFGTAETAIGRWNKGYYYPQGVTYNVSSNQFSVTNAPTSALDSDWVYAAGIPATNLPTCSSVTMSPQAQTKAFTSFNANLKLTLDTSSRMAFQFVGGTTFVGYDLILRDEVGNVHTFATPGGANAPLQGVQVESNQEFGSPAGLLLPNGQTIYFRGLLAGVGGTKAVITVSSPTHTNSSVDLAAAFVQEGVARNCSQPNFSSGVLSAVPSAGYYAMSLMDRISYTTFSFFSNGTPNLNGSTNLNASSGVEKKGNDILGIGILTPGFTYGGELAQVPQPYIYLKLPPNPVLPRGGSGSYHLIASTPYVVKSPTQLISVSSIQTADLTIQFDQYPLGTPNANMGTCKLTIDNQPVVGADESYFPTAGLCSGIGGIRSFGEFFDGGITPDDNRYAVIRYTKHYSPQVKGEVALLFEKNP